MTAIATNQDAQPKSSLGREYWTYNTGDPTGPVAQFRMAQLVDFDSRLTDPARAVYRFLIGWYMRGHGDALASVRHIVSTMRARAPDGARHISRSAVQRAIILLIETGWLVRRFTGKGRSGSRYVPVLNVLELAAQGTLPSSAEAISVPLHRDTNSDSVASHSTGTPLSHATGTLDAVESHLPGLRPSYINPSTDGVTCKEDNDSAAPTAPLSVGLSATDAGTAEDETGGTKAKDPFDDLYRAYGVRGEKAAARRAYEKLAPATDLHAAMIATAKLWREAAGDSIERMHLKRWIEEERYDEDPKGERKPREKKAKKKSEPKNVADDYFDDKEDDVPEPDVSPFAPRGRNTFKIRNTYVSMRDGDKILNLTLVAIDAPGSLDVEFAHSFAFEAKDKHLQDEGQRRLSQICRATGLIELDDSDDLKGQHVTATIDDYGRITYEPLADNDNTHLAEAA